MSTPRIIKSCPRRSLSPFLQGRKAHQLWTVSEDRRLVQFVVEYNKGKKRWNTGRKVLDKYFRHLRKCGHPTQRTVSGMAFRLHVIRRSVRENLASDDYGVDLESRMQLAALCYKKQKPDRNLSGRPRVRAKSGGREPWDQLDDDSDEEDDDDDSDRSTLREVTPHPVKAGNQTTTRNSNAVASFSHPKITVKFNVLPEPQSVSATALPGRTNQESREPAGFTGEVEEDNSMELNTGHGPLMVHVENGAADSGLSQSATSVAPLPHLTRSSADMDVRMPEVGIKAVNSATSSAAQDGARLAKKVVPKTPGSRGVFSPGRVSAVITLDDAPEVKMEANSAGAPDDFAIVKQLALTPGVTLNEAFTMYLKNKNLYRRLSMELGDK